MPLMEKKQIETTYSSYEEIGRAFSSPGAECTEIYLCTHITKQKPSHYEIIRRPEEKEALLSSPYIKKTKLAWSKKQGALIPLKSITSCLPPQQETEPYATSIEKEGRTPYREKEIRLFISELISDNKDIREHAFKELKKASDASVQPLIETLLEHKNLKVRRQAAEALGTINTHACIKALLNIFSDPRPEMSRRANYALWLIGKPAVSSLVEKLRDHDANVRGRAALAIGQMIHRRMADPSDRIWLDPSAIDATDNIRGDINVEAVRSEAISPLEKLLQDEDASVNKYALIALEMLKSYKKSGRREEDEAKKKGSKAKHKKAKMHSPPLQVLDRWSDEKRAEWLNKAKKLEEEGHYEKAIEHYDLVIGENLDGNGWAHYLKGRALVNLDRLEEAHECLKKSLALDPDHSRCALELGRVFYKLGLEGEARLAFKKVLSMSLIVNGDDDEAMKWLKKMDEEITPKVIMPEYECEECAVRWSDEEIGVNLFCPECGGLLSPYVQEETIQPILKKEMKESTQSDTKTTSLEINNNQDKKSKEMTGYEKVGRLFRLLGWISLIAGLSGGFLLFTQAELKSDEMTGAIVLFFSLSILYLPLGKAIKEHRRWGRIVGNIVGVLALFGIPIGTIIGIYVLKLLNESWNERPPSQPGRLGIEKSEEFIGCVRCGGRNFEHDSCWDEYSCENCGWASKEKPKGKVNVIELRTKDKKN